jgi:hypothetical protein
MLTFCQQNAEQKKINKKIANTFFENVAKLKCFGMTKTNRNFFFFFLFMSWALLEKPPIVQLLKIFSAFYGIRRFITVLTRALHWPLS